MTTTQTNEKKEKEGGIDNVADFDPWEKFKCTGHEHFGQNERDCDVDDCEFEICDECCNNKYDRCPTCQLTCGETFNCYANREQNRFRGP